MEASAAAVKAEVDKLGFLRNLGADRLIEHPVIGAGSGGPRTPTARDSLGPLIFGLSYLAAVQGCRQHHR
ncbi:hypothetical protein [Nocardia vinacea]|uniref:hypothetical protein n=1 Tax=Nocardia vinacea TaxID=96468 RepID=UPI0012F64543|nr:hypothetical protein [Nocardia vinacea]